MGHEIDGRRTLLKQRHDNSRSKCEIVGDETQQAIRDNNVALPQLFPFAGVDAACAFVFVFVFVFAP